MIRLSFRSACIGIFSSSLLVGLAISARSSAEGSKSNWAACLGSLRLTEMNQSPRPLNSRDETEKLVSDFLHRSITADGALDQAAISKSAKPISFARGTPDVLTWPAAVHDRSVDVDLIFKIFRDTDGSMVRIDISSRQSGNDLVSRFRHYTNADQGTFFAASIQFNPKAGPNADQCLITSASGDVNFDYFYCQQLQTISSSQGACDSSCAEPILKQFYKPTLFSPADYDSWRKRGHDAKDFRPLAKHLFADLCEPIYSKFNSGTQIPDSVPTHHSAPGSTDHNGTSQ